MGMNIFGEMCVLPKRLMVLRREVPYARSFGEQKKDLYETCEGFWCVTV